jgi:2-desacetyl-2-hydroxyethyl bacteriochlorophyllide A dehydrogenase
VFAGDVAGPAYHAVTSTRLQPGELAGVLGLGPVGLMAVQIARLAGAAAVYAVDSVPERLAVAERFGATPIHLAEQDVREEVKRATGGRGLDVVIDAVGDPAALDTAIRLARKAGRVSATGVYAERCEVHMGLVWIKSLTIESGQANVIAHVDPVLELLARGVLDPSPLVTHHMPLDEAVEGYAIYDRREALKIVLTP